MQTRLERSLSILTLSSVNDDDVGTGGGCISFGGSVCDPFTNEITGLGATETLTATIPLDQPLLIFNALYMVADNDFNLETATIDPDLVLTLPEGVSFSSVSGNSGGSSSGPSVPEPGSLALFGGALLLLAGLRRRASLLVLARPSARSGDASATPVRDRLKMGHARAPQRLSAPAAASG